MPNVSSNVESAQTACTKIHTFADNLKTSILNQVNAFVTNDLADWQGEAKTAFVNQCTQVLPNNVTVFLDGNLKVLGTNAVKNAQIQAEQDRLNASQMTG